MTSPQDNEFDVYARWTQEAVAALGTEYAVAAACRGSAGPGALRWLAAPLARDSMLLDVGGGMGGPAAFAAAEAGVHPVVVEPMRGACRAAAALFGLPAVVGDGEALPFATGSIRAAWCLGVLCTTDRQAELLGELGRVLAPEASLGLLVLVRRGDVAGGPIGNAFPTDAGLAALLAGAGFAVSAQAELDDLGEPPPDWRHAAAEVERFVRERHGDDPRHAEAVEQERRIARLLSERRVVAVVLRTVSRRR